MSIYLYVCNDLLCRSMPKSQKEKYEDEFREWYRHDVSIIDEITKLCIIDSHIKATVKKCISVLWDDMQKARIPGSSQKENTIIYENKFVTFILADFKQY